MRKVAATTRVALSTTLTPSRERRAHEDCRAMEFARAPDVSKVVSKNIESDLGDICPANSEHIEALDGSIGLYERKG